MDFETVYKNTMQTDKYIFFFKEDSQLKIETKSYLNCYEIKNETLGILTDNIVKFARIFEEIYIDLLNKNNYTESELYQKKYLDCIIDSVEEKKKKKEKTKINSRKKGQRGEHLVIKALGEHFPGLKILRTPGSGAFATHHSIKTKDDILGGDLFAENNESPEYERFIRFHFEIKNYGVLPDFLGAITYKKSEPLTEWIRQAKRDSQRSRKRLVIIFKSNYSPIFGLIDNKFDNNGDEVRIGFDKRKCLLSFNFMDFKYHIFYLSDLRF